MDSGTKVVVVGGVGCGAFVVMGAVAALLLYGGRSVSPIAGDADVDLVLTREAGDAAADGARMMRRLEALGVDAELESSEGRVHIIAHGVSSPQAVAEVVAPARRLAFYLVDDSADTFAPEAFPSPPPGVRAMRDGERMVLGGDTREAVLALIARVELPPGRSALVECQRWQGAPSDQAECFPRLLELPPILTGESLTDASAQIDEMSGMPNVMVSFDDAGARHFGEVTAASVHRRLAVVLDDDVLSSPVIASAIPGGHAMITLGAGKDLADAQVLAAGMTPGHALSESWQIERAVLLEPGG